MISDLYVCEVFLCVLFCVVQYNTTVHTAALRCLVLESTCRGVQYVPVQIGADTLVYCMLPSCNTHVLATELV